MQLAARDSTPHHPPNPPGLAGPRLVFQRPLGCQSPAGLPTPLAPTIPPPSACVPAQALCHFPATSLRTPSPLPTNPLTAPQPPHPPPPAPGLPAHCWARESRGILVGCHPIPLEHGCRGQGQCLHRPLTVRQGGDSCGLATQSSSLPITPENQPLGGTHRNAPLPPATPASQDNKWSPQQPPAPRCFYVAHDLLRAFWPRCI